MNLIKKYWVYLVMGLIILGFIAVIIINKQYIKDKKTDETGDENKNVNEYQMKADLYDKLGFQPDDYIELGQYKGLKAEREKITVSDEEVMEEINNELLDYKVVDRAAKEGDAVNVDIEAFIEGKKEDALSLTDCEFVVGEAEYAYEFDEAVEGKKKGDTFEVTVEAPEFPLDEDVDYSDKTVDFKVKVKEVQESYYLELTDEWVQENYADDDEINNVDELKNYVKASIKEGKEEEADEEVYVALWNQVLEGSKMDDYPQDLYDLVVYEDDADIAYQAEMWGMSEDEYCEFFEIDRQKDYIENTKSKLAVWAIVKAEKLSVTDEEIENAYYENYEDTGYATVDEMKEAYDPIEIEYSLLENIVYDLIYENAEITEK